MLTSAEKYLETNFVVQSFAEAVGYLLATTVLTLGGFAGLFASALLLFAGMYISNHYRLVASKAVPSSERRLITLILALTGMMLMATWVVIYLAFSELLGTATTTTLWISFISLAVISMLRYRLELYFLNQEFNPQPKQRFSLLCACALMAYIGVWLLVPILLSNSTKQVDITLIGVVILTWTKNLLLKLAETQA